MVEFGISLITSYPSAGYQPNQSDLYFPRKFQSPRQIDCHLIFTAILFSSSFTAVIKAA